MVTVKQLALKRKIEKKRREVTRLLDQSGSVEEHFLAPPSLPFYPSPKQFEELVIVSKFGPGEPLSSVSTNFFYSYMFGVLDYMLAAQRARTPFEKRQHSSLIPNAPPDANCVGMRLVRSETWGTIIISLAVRESLFKFVERLGDDDMVFEQVEGESFFVDEESQSIALDMRWSRVTPAELFDLGIAPSRSEAEKMTQRDKPSPLAPFGSPLLYSAWLTTPDELHQDAQRQSMHGVIPHMRHLRSGQVVPIRGHSRSNPIHLKDEALITSEVDYLVYRAFDADGKLRYIGEGRQNRPQHVNSGASHNFKLNEHYFLRGRMRVEIVTEYISKQEALAIETFLIRANAGPDLWNVKENEPEFE